MPNLSLQNYNFNVIIIALSLNNGFVKNLLLSGRLLIGVLTRRTHYYTVFTEFEVL